MKKRSETRNIWIAFLVLAIFVVLVLSIIATTSITGGFLGLEKLFGSKCQQEGKSCNCNNKCCDGFVCAIDETGSDICYKEGTTRPYIDCGGGTASEGLAASGSAGIPSGSGGTAAEIPIARCKLINFERWRCNQFSGCQRDDYSGQFSTQIDCLNHCACEGSNPK